MWKKLQINSLLAIIIPSVLFALLVFQIYHCRSHLLYRNSYLLESLPEHSDWLWDALSADKSSRFMDSSDELGNMRTQKLNIKDSQVSSVNTRDYHRAILLPGLPTLNVHYLWCVDGYFELGHYLAIMSVIEQLQPDRVIIHYRKEPRTDPQGYWRWLEDLQRNVVMLNMRPLSDSRICSHDLSAGVAHDDYDFPDPYGVFLLGDIVVTNLTRMDVSSLMIRSFSLKSSSLVTKTAPAVTEDELRQSQIFLIPDSEPYHMSQAPGRVVISCPSMTAVSGIKPLTSIRCISINSFLAPEEMLTRNTSFHRIARKIFYGNPDIIKTRMVSDVQIPNIVHIILIDEIGEITPLTYVSIKSAYFKGKVDDVFVHGPKPPSGALWDRLLNQDEIQVKYIPSPSREQLNIKHASLVYALYTLLQHGGIAHFGDVIFLRPVPTSPRCAEAVLTPHYSEYRLKHQSTNTAILAGARGSEFLEMFLARVRQEDLRWPDARADDIATHVREMIPASVFLDSQLTSHQKCISNRCQVAGGHDHPRHTYTTRMIWSSEPPHTLDQLLLIEGPTKGDIKNIIEASHFMHIRNSS